MLHDDARWIGGFQNIVDHLRERSIHGRLDSDTFGAQEKADITAYAACSRDGWYHGME